MSSRHARLDVLLDGLRITRSASDAARRHTERVLVLEWDEVAGATLELTGKGRSIVRVAVVGPHAVDDHRDDPYAVKAGRDQAESAVAVVDRINEEAATRRRWHEQAAATPPVDDGAVEAG